ncbi:AraC family transcriptional regulator [Massilia sp. TS11]|uniref:AraC family transcriptional regulator n=1 Tax=Massilia sp. TS11 TaxID=2908003 RepID=UPI001ED9CBAF|nr:AraC family transcriptional regulator [Massilia sp. TS11]MCG2584762.1 AraC family transcriptional regulator [Massilia sp. TS11]
MIDPLAEVVSLLQPGAPFSKLVVASAPWAVRRTETGRPFYFVILEGGCHLTVHGPDGSETITLHEGDFAMVPAARSFSTSSLDRQPPRLDEEVITEVTTMPGGARVGNPNGPVDVRMLVGNFVFGSPDSALLVSLLPRYVHIRGEQRLSTLVQLVGDESRAERPARELVLARLLEVLLIEALRSAGSTGESAGLVRGLADAKLAVALRCMHAQPAATWTVAQLARAAAMSRSAFSERFTQAVGIAPMSYLLGWRMALARQLLRRRELKLADIAERVGYASVSAFGLAFTRHVGMPPRRYSQMALDDAAAA